MLKTEFDEALRLFNLHEYAAVARICQPHLQHPMFKLLLATTYGKLAQFEQAEQLFLQLQQQYPTNLDVLFNFAVVLKLQQRTAEALLLLQRSLALNKAYHPSHHAIAGVYASQGNIALAKVHFEQAILLQPQNLTYLFGAADLDYCQAEYQSAADKLYFLLSQGYHAAALRLLAPSLYKLQQVRQMRALCLQYANRIDNEPDVLMYAGLIELDEKCYMQAMTLLQQAKDLRAEPCFETDANLLYCRYLLNADPQTLNEIISLSEQERTEQSFYFGANLLETLGQLDDAAQLLTIALSLYPSAPGLLLIKAKILTRQQHLTEALAVLSEINETGTSELQLDVCYQKVQIFEAKAEYHLAAQQIEHAGQQSRQAQVLDVLQQDVARAQQDLSLPMSDLSAHQRRIIFIIGFPRSGTTLLESKLAVLNNVKILEETNAVKQFYLHLQEMAGELNVMSFLAQQTAEQRTALADKYLQSLQHYCVLDEQDIIIDKMPLNAVYLTPVLSLFPQARVILMQRHPMDVCISSLKQRMINLFSVESFAQSYHCYFTLLQQLQQKFADQVLAIKYEQLVTEYQQNFTNIVAHCGLNEDDRTDKASVTMFNTPSYHQVSQPLYTKAVNSYLNYQSFFQFQHPLLLDWCQKLNYMVPEDHIV